MEFITWMDAAVLPSDKHSPNLSPPHLLKVSVKRLRTGTRFHTIKDHSKLIHENNTFKFHKRWERVVFLFIFVCLFFYHNYQEKEPTLVFLTSGSLTAKFSFQLH